MKLFVCYLFMITVLLGQPQKASAQSVVNFSKDLKKICSCSNDILAKKIFITILKLEKRAVDPCEDSGLNRLLESCEEEIDSCSVVVSVYREAVYKHEGKVIGQ